MCPGFEILNMQCMAHTNTLVLLKWCNLENQQQGLHLCLNSWEETVGSSLPLPWIESTSRVTSEKQAILPSRKAREGQMCIHDYTLNENFAEKLQDHQMKVDCS